MFPGPWSVDKDHKNNGQTPKNVYGYYAFFHMNLLENISLYTVPNSFQQPGSYDNSDR